MYYISIVLLTPILLILWIYFVLTIKNYPVSNSTTSIQLNIINVSSNNIIRDDSGENNKKIKYHVPKFMLELYEKNKVNGKKFTSPDVVRSLIPKHAEPLIENEILQEFSSENHLLIFDLPAADVDEKFVGAELKILTIVDIQIKSVERKLVVSLYDDQTKQLEPLQNLHVCHINNTWLSFNLTNAVLNALKLNNTEKHLKIVITVTTLLSDPPNKLRLSLMPTIKNNFEHDYPILLLSYTSSNNNITEITHNRQKRSIEEDYEEETNNVWDDEPKTKNQLKKLKRIRNSCRKRPLYINFSEIDYDVWIVQPSGYEAYQCQGRCFYPVAEHLNPTKHAIVQALVHSVAPLRASRSCCVPTILDSISILYVDGKGVLTYRYAYKDMVVLECGCR